MRSGQGASQRGKGGAFPDAGALLNVARVGGVKQRCIRMARGDDTMIRGDGRMGR